MAYIYLITNNLNNKKYIGVTNNSLEKRWKSHLYDSNVISQAIKKHGAGNFSIQSIYECATIDEAYELEPKFIIEYDSKYPKGYNISDGGKGSQVGKRKPTSNEVKQKISDAVKKNHHWVKLSEERKEEFREMWRNNAKNRVGKKRQSYNNGLFTNTVWINNGCQRKRVSKDSLEDWLSLGWQKGHDKFISERP